MITATRNATSAFNPTTTPAGTPPTAVQPSGDTPPKGAAEPTTGSRALPTNGNGMGRDEFLKMLVAQLKNQDPLNPMDGKDMAAQLAQFSTVEQLISINSSLEAQSKSAGETAEAIKALDKSQNERADELAQLIEGQMAMATVGKTGVTLGNNAFVDKEGKGSVLVDMGSRKGAGRITLTNDKNEVVGQVSVGNVSGGQASFELSDYTWNPKLAPGKYTYKFEVATDGGPFVAAKTYTTGRITGMRYDKGNPILIIGDSLSVPMSQLTQVRS